MRAVDRAYRTLKEEILEWKLAPGAELSEVDQAERLGVSRTPLREALRKLESEGLAFVGKGRTLRVAQLAVDDIKHLFELREALETQAARLAAERGTPTEFEDLAHKFRRAGSLISQDDPGRIAYYQLVDELDGAIDKSMRNPYLERALQNVRLHVARARKLARDKPARLIEAAAEHALIARAIAAGNQALAAQSTAVHLANSLASILQTLDTARPGDPDGDVRRDQTSEDRLVLRSK